MNYMERVAQMVGVELGEPFEIAQYPAHLFAFNAMGVFNIEEAEPMTNVFVLRKLLTGEYQIIRQPWSPKEGDTYYYVDLDEDVIVTQYNSNNIHDVMNVRVGNCYRTAEEVTLALMEQWGGWYMGGACPVRDKYDYK